MITGIDFNAPLSNPFQLYEKLHASGKSVCYGKNGDIGVFRYNDVESVLKNSDQYSSIAIKSLLCPEWLDSQYQRSEFIVMQDSPVCDKNRKFINKFFVGSVIESLTATMRKKAIELALEFPENGNFIQNYSYPYISFILNQWLGTTFDFEKIKKWIGVIEDFTTECPDQEKKQKTESIIKEQRAEFLSLIHARKTKPENDFISKIIKNAGNQLSDDDLLNITELLVSAGFHTTIHLLSQIVILLIRNKPVRDLIKGDQSELITRFVDEMLRFFPTIHILTREVVKQATLSDGHVIEKGAQIRVMLAAANRDPSVFKNPSQFNIFRSNNKQCLTFGAGPHFCLGRALAHAEMCIATGALLNYFPLDSYKLKADKHLSTISQILIPNILGLKDINQCEINMGEK